MSIETGMTHSVTVTVTQNLLASSVGSGLLDVFATPMMIAQMELAASECIAGELEPGQVSVGGAIGVTHTNPSPFGARITATATITAVDGRRVDFDVKASDNAGEIGSGTHTRFVVQAEKLLAKASTRGL